MTKNFDKTQDSELQESFNNFILKIMSHNFIN